MGHLEVIARGQSRTHLPSADSREAEEARAFLQQRVGGFGLIVGCIFSLFMVWRVGAVVADHLLDAPDVNPWAVPGIVAEVSLFLGIWLFCRRRPRSLRTLRVLDVAATLLGSAGLTLMPVHIPYPVRPDYIMILGLTYIALVRAIYVPSNWQRTAALAVAIAPLLLVSLFFTHYRGHDPAYYTPSAGVAGGITDTSLRWAIRWTIIGSVWWLATSVLASVTSRVFYGLRQQVRDARKLGQYTLLEPLGEGGMGIVYRARHALLRRPTAVKLLPPDKYGEESVARFEREVQLTALLTHPNTVRIFDYGRTADAVFYYAMELLDGARLDQVVRETGPLPAGRVIHILDQIAGALAEAHAIGLIHRDIKPANIILTEQGGEPDVAKVLDFGLVKEVAAVASGDAATEAAVTVADRITGTPQYMAPESIATPGEVDARADLYAVGAVGYFLLAGVEVFKGGSVVEICSHHLHTEPLPPSKRVDRAGSSPVPGDLEAVILSCLSKSPSARPATARALRAALARCSDAGTWTEDDARAWWSAHGAALRAVAGADVPEVAATLSLSVDPARAVETVPLRSVPRQRG